MLTRSRTWLSGVYPQLEHRLYRRFSGTLFPVILYFIQPIVLLHHLVLAAGFEPTLGLSESHVLPLHYARIFNCQRLQATSVAAKWWVPRESNPLGQLRTYRVTAGTASIAMTPMIGRIGGNRTPMDRVRAGYSIR